MREAKILKKRGAAQTTKSPARRCDRAGLACSSCRVRLRRSRDRRPPTPTPWRRCRVRSRSSVPEYDAAVQHAVPLKED